MSLELSPRSTLPWNEGLRGQLEALLPSYVPSRRWFHSKTKILRKTRLLDAIPLTARAALTVVEVSFSDAPAERYVLPLTLLRGSAADRLEREGSALAISRLSSGDLLCDALADDEALQALLAAFDDGASQRGARSTLRFERFDEGRISGPSLAPHPLKVEQSNSSIAYGEWPAPALMLKIFRRLEGGISTDLEVGRALTAVDFAHAPRVLGAISWRPPRGEAETVAVLQTFVRNEGDAWTRTLERLGRLLADRREPPVMGPGTAPELAAEVVRARQLGQRTAQLHAALSSAPGEAFSPEPFTLEQQESAVSRVAPTLNTLLLTLQKTTPPHPEVAALIALYGELRARFATFRRRRVGGQRIRVHGDLHLGQVLETMGDVAFLDFEGEPARPLAERRAKRSPLVDVAGMLRSYHYASVSAARAAMDPALAGQWMTLWHAEVTHAYLRGYQTELGAVPLLPDASHLSEALGFFVLEKCLYELGYELNNRPDWIDVPLAGLLSLVRPAARS